MSGLRAPPIRDTIAAMMETETPAHPGSIAAFADDLDRNGFVRIPGLLDPPFMDTLLLRAHARLFRKSAEARAKVKSTRSLCHLRDTPDFAEIIRPQSQMGRE